MRRGIVAIGALCAAACATAPAPAPPLFVQTASIAPATEPSPLVSARVEAAPVEGPPPPLVFAPKRILMLGDSKMATDFGAALQAELAQHEQLVIARRGKSATGLARPDAFDWMAEASRLIEQHAPEVAIVILGGNDGQDLISRDRRAPRVTWGTAAWREAYRARVTALLELLTGDGRRVVWMEVTAVDRPRLEAKLAIIRGVQREAAVAFGDRVIHLDTRDHFYGPDGALLRAVVGEGARASRPLRLEDGIHFTVAGSRWLARRVYRDLAPRLGLP